MPPPDEKKKKKKGKKGKKRKSNANAATASASTAVVDVASATTTSKMGPKKGVRPKSLNHYYADMKEAGMGSLANKMHAVVTIYEALLLNDGVITPEWIEYVGELCDVLVLDVENKLGLYSTNLEEIMMFEEHSDIQKVGFGKQIADCLRDINPSFIVVTEDEQSINGVRVNDSDRFANLLGMYALDKGNNSATVVLSNRARRYHKLGDDGVCVEVFAGVDGYEVYCDYLIPGVVGAKATAELTISITASPVLTAYKGDITEKG